MQKAQAIIDQKPSDIKNLKGYRYLVQIQFKHRFDLLVRIWDITEEVKTLKEAQSYKGTIDDTVNKAQIVDTVTNTTVERWK